MVLLSSVTGTEPLFYLIRTIKKRLHYFMLNYDILPIISIFLKPKDHPFTLVAESSFSDSKKLWFEWVTACLFFFLLVMHTLHHLQATTGWGEVRPNFMGSFHSQWYLLWNLSRIYNWWQWCQCGGYYNYWLKTFVLLILSLHTTIGYFQLKQWIVL